MSENSVEVRDLGPYKGRGLIATKNISKGDVIFVEKPLIACQFAWNESCGYRACEYCLRPLEDAQENACRLAGDPEIKLPYFPLCCSVDKSKHVPCTYNCGKTYCSSDCRDQAWTIYHQTLCLNSPVTTPDVKKNLQDLVEIWKQVHYPPETANIMLVVKLIASIKQAPDKRGALNMYATFVHNLVASPNPMSDQNEARNEHLVHKLMGEKFKEALETLRIHIGRALYDADLDSCFTENGFKELVALIGRNGQGVGTSSLAEWSKNVESLQFDGSPEEIAQKKRELNGFIETLYDLIEEKTGLEFLNNEGCGLYSLQSISNHCCEPNAECTFPYSDFTLVMKATNDITAGEEVCISYLDECTRNRSRHSRQKILRENYLFTCQCFKCMAEVNEPDVTSEEEEEDEEIDEEAMS